MRFDLAINAMVLKLYKTHYDYCLYPMILQDIKPKTIKDTIQNTKQYSKEVDKLGRKSFRYVGEKAEIIFNKSKEIITGWLKK